MTQSNILVSEGQTSKSSQLKIEQNASQEDAVFMEHYEEQDKLIGEGISMICLKIIECFDLLL